MAPTARVGRRQAGTHRRAPSSIRMAAIALAIAAQGCAKKEKAPERQPPKVIVEQPTRGEVTASWEYTGTIRSVEEAGVRARVPGVLERVLFAPSTDVKEGDLLFVIEQAPYQARLESARGSVEQAEAALELAKATLSRTDDVVEAARTT